MPVSSGFARRAVIEYTKLEKEGSSFPFTPESRFIQRPSRKCSKRLLSFRAHQQILPNYDASGSPTLETLGRHGRPGDRPAANFARIPSRLFTRTTHKLPTVKLRFPSVAGID